MWLGVLVWLCATAAAAPEDRAPIRFDGMVLETDWPLGDPGFVGRRFVIDTLRKGELVVVDPGSLEGRRGGSVARFVLTGTLVGLSEERRLLYSEMELEIAWTLLDEATGEVAYRATTFGYAANRRTTSRRVVAYDALEDAISRLTAREPLRALLDSAGPPPPITTELGTLQVARCPTSPPPLPKGLKEATRAAVTVSTASGRSGSAFLVSPDGWALTAAHVVSGLDEVDVLLQSGPSLTASVVRTRDDVDVALVRIPGKAHPCLPLELALPDIGADLFVLGSPLGASLDVSVSRGIVSGVRTFHERPFLQTDAAVNPGSSGGPMLDEEGSVVALTSWKVVGGAEGLGFGVPTEATLEALGVELGDRSAVPRPVAPPVRPVTALERVDDVADESRMGTLTPRIERRVRGTGAGMVFGGLALGGLGAAMAISSYDTWTNNPAKSQAELYGSGTLNAVGWTTMAAGASLALGGAIALGGL